MCIRDRLITMIEAVRSLKVDYNLKPSMDIEVIIRDENGNNMPSVSYINAILQKMCHATWISEDSAVEMAVRPILNGTLNVPLAAIINVEEEIAVSYTHLDVYKRQVATLYVSYFFHQYSGAVKSTETNI